MKQYIETEIDWNSTDPEYWARIDREMNETDFHKKIIKDANEHDQRMKEFFLNDFYRKFPDVYEYLIGLYENISGVYTESTYFMMNDLLRYIQILIKKKKIEDIKKILDYLNSVFISGNQEAYNLIGIGFLEDSEIIKDVLPILVPLLPKKMNDHFNNHYSHYLTNDDHETIIRKSYEDYQKTL